MLSSSRRSTSQTSRTMRCWYESAQAWQIPSDQTFNVSPRSSRSTIPTTSSVETTTFSPHASSPGEFTGGRVMRPPFKLLQDGADVGARSSQLGERKDAGRRDVQVGMAD